MIIVWKFSLKLRNIMVAMRRKKNNKQCKVGILITSQKGNL